MTFEEALQKFGLPALPVHREEIRRLLTEEIEREREDGSGKEMLRTLCVQLFSLGDVDDALLIWEAKQSSFDAACGLDVQFVCGAGMEETKRRLAGSHDPAASAALRYIKECERAGDFVEWCPGQTVETYRRYYRLDGSDLPE